VNYPLEACLLQSRYCCAVSAVLLHAAKADSSLCPRIVLLQIVLRFAGGICGACVARVAEGAVDQSDVADLEFTLEPQEIEDGMALLCMSRPKSDVSIETQCDWGVSLGFKEWQGASGKFVGAVDPLMGKKWADMTAEERAAAEAEEAEKQTVSAKA
jgi:2Fe-2S iron-sulfur cluster binding domain